MRASRKIAISVLPDISMPANPSGIPHSSAKTSRIASAPAAPVLINVASISNSTSFMALHVLQHVQVPVCAQPPSLMHRIVGSLSTERKRKVQARLAAGQMPVDRWPRPAYTRQHLARRLCQAPCTAGVSLYSGAGGKHYVHTGTWGDGLYWSAGYSALGGTR